MRGGDAWIGAGDAWEEARTQEGAVKGGCQGQWWWWQWQQWQRHVQGSGNLSLWLGPCESGARAGDAWVAGEKAWVMHPRHRASSSWLAMGPHPL